MRKLYRCVLLFSYVLTHSVQGQAIAVSGQVQEAKTQTALAGASVYVPQTPYGTTTDAAGRFQLRLPAGDSLTLVISALGYQPVRRTILPTRGLVIQVALTPSNTLTEVTVRPPIAGRNRRSPVMSSLSLTPDQVANLPAFMGEPDLLRTLQLLPGVQKGTEGQTGLYVRGGGSDQNLILLDDALIYNSGHLFGFFSIFNNDALASIDLLKGALPARYGGRLSSVLDVRLKDGDPDSILAAGSIGLIASHLTLEGPLIKPREGGPSVTFLLSGRRTYLDLLTRALRNGQNFAFNQTGFYDATAKVTVRINERHRIGLTGYTGKDQFMGYRPAASDRLSTQLRWGNSLLSLRWDGSYARQTSVNASLTTNQYELLIGTQDPIRVLNEPLIVTMRYRSWVRDLTGRLGMERQLGQHRLGVGGLSTWHHFQPAVTIQGGEANRPNRLLELSFSRQAGAIESGLYLEDRWRPTSRWQIDAGFRLSHYQLVGAPNRYRPSPGGVLQRRGEGLDYVGHEPRMAVAYQTKNGGSLTASWTRMFQYVHLLSNTGLGLPVELWEPTTARVPPQRSEQWAVGWNKPIPRSGLSLTIEAYHKTMLGLVTYREGSSFLLPDNPEASFVAWESNVITGQGRSYGLETLLQKHTGRLTGWLGYTLSWPPWQFPDLNGGRAFYPRHDRRHDLSIVTSYQPSPKLTLSATWVYGSGQALTIPLARFSVSGHSPSALPGGPPLVPFTDYSNVQAFGPRGNTRGEAYHRLDVGCQLRRRRPHFERTWSFGLYNAYGRPNPFFYSLESKAEEGKHSQTVLVRYSLFRFIPSVAYQFQFH